MLSILKNIFGKQSEPKQQSKSTFTRLSHDKLLSPYQSSIDEIYVLSGLRKKHFEYLYLEPLQKYAECMQQVPASEAHHHSVRGGMLRHTIEIVINAMRLRRGAILPPQASPEDIDQRKDVWTFVIYICALLHDSGKIVTDIRQVDPSTGRQWHLMSPGQPPEKYQIKFNSNRKHKFHERLPAFVLHEFLSPSTMKWIMQDEEAFGALIHFMVGDYAESVISSIVQKADQASVVANLGGNIQSINAKPAQLPLSERILRAWRTLVKDNALPINRKGAAGFIDGDWAYFASKRTLDVIKERMRSEGQSVPNDNVRMMDELQQFEVIVPNDDKAIWKVKVTLDEWNSNLSMLKVPAAKIWPDIENRPAPVESLSVELVDVNGDPIEDKPKPKKDAPKTTDPEPVKTKPEAKSLPENKVSTEPKDTDLSPTKAPKPETEIEDEIGPLDELIGPAVGEPVQEEDLSGFDDSIDTEYDYDYEDTEAPVETDTDSETDTPELSNDTVPEAESDTSEDEQDEHDKIMAEIHHKASTAKSSEVAKHNAFVIEHAEAPVVFDDPDSAGALFIKWLITGLKEGKIPANQPANMVHRVEEGLFLVSPAIFRACERDTGIKWDRSQRELQKKKINLKTQTGQNIFEYEIVSASGRNQRKKIKGLLIPNPDTKLGFNLKEKNPWMVSTDKVKL